MYTFLIIAHLLGTVLAIGGATMIELHLTRALKDGQISNDEQGMLGLDYRVVRWGFIISLLSGFGFLLSYKMTGQTFRLYDPVLWAKIVLIIIVGTNTLLLQAHKISLYWGAALSFVSWWSIGLLGVFSTNRVRFNLFPEYSFIASFMSVILVFGVAVIVGAAVLHFIRKKVNPLS